MDVDPIGELEFLSFESFSQDYTFHNEAESPFPTVFLPLEPDSSSSDDFGSLGREGTENLIRDYGTFLEPGSPSLLSGDEQLGSLLLQYAHFAPDERDASDPVIQFHTCKLDLKRRNLLLERVAFVLTNSSIVTPHLVRCSFDVAVCMYFRIDQNVLRMMECNSTPSLQILEVIAEKYSECIEVEALHDLVLMILSKINGEEPNTRYLLSSLLHTIYKNNIHLRSLIRKDFTDYFLQCGSNEGTHAHHGTVNLLDVLLCIAQGYNVPLKEEHKMYCINHIFPLFNSSCLYVYEDVLCKVIMEYACRETEIIKELLCYLFDICPGKTIEHCKILFNRISALLAMISGEQYELLALKFYNCLCTCIKYYNVPEVTDLALSLFDQPHVSHLILNTNIQMAYLVLLPALQKGLLCHRPSKTSQKCQTVMDSIVHKQTGIFFQTNNNNNHKSQFIYNVNDLCRRYNNNYGFNSMSSVG